MESCTKEVLASHIINSCRQVALFNSHHAYHYVPIINIVSYLVHGCSTYHLSFQYVLVRSSHQHSSLHCLLIPQVARELTIAQVETLLILLSTSSVSTLLAPHLDPQNKPNSWVVSFISTSSQLGNKMKIDLLFLYRTYLSSKRSEFKLQATQIANSTEHVLTINTQNLKRYYLFFMLYVRIVVCSNCNFHRT